MGASGHRNYDHSRLEMIARTVRDPDRKVMVPVYVPSFVRLSAHLVQVAQEPRSTVRSVALTRQMAPHRGSVEQGIEPKGFLRIRMADVSISGEKWIPAVRILIGAAE